MISGINTILGLALIGAPFMFGYTDNTLALAGSVILGVIVTTVSGYKLLAQDTNLWEDEVDMAAGVGAVLLPIIVGFSTATTVFWTIVVLGAGLIVLAGYQLYETKLRVS